MSLVKKIIQLKTFSVVGIITSALAINPTSVLALSWGDYWINLGTRNVGRCLEVGEKALRAAGASNIRQGKGPSMFGKVSGAGVAIVCSPDGSQAIIAADNTNSCNAVARVLEQDDSAKHC